jgi:ABC-type uncharacterized transport system permease subunit
LDILLFILKFKIIIQIKINFWYPNLTHVNIKKTLENHSTSFIIKKKEFSKCTVTGSSQQKTCTQLIPMVQAASANHHFHLLLELCVCVCVYILCSETSFYTKLSPVVHDPKKFNASEIRIWNFLFLCVCMYILYVFISINVIFFKLLGY